MEDDEKPLPAFTGFSVPEANWYRTPDNWTDISADITNIAELKIVEYVLRHTWGFREYGLKKHITIDEFVHGRKRRDGSRMDRGTGLSERAVRYGLARAVQHGFIEEEVDRSDRARIKKSYSVRMKPVREPDPSTGQDSNQDMQAEVQIVHPEVQDVHLKAAYFAPRTETDTSDHPIEDTSSNRRGSMADASERETNRSMSRSPLPRASGFEALREVIAQLPHAGTSTVDPPHRPSNTPTDKIAVAITELSEKLGDAKHRSANKAQAMHLYLAAGTSEEGFVQRLYEASAITRDEIHRKRQAGEAPIARPMAYFFTVVRDLLGIKEALVPPYGPAREGRRA